jgi:hypothetical protein
MLRLAFFYKYFLFKYNVAFLNRIFFHILIGFICCSGYAEMAKMSGLPEFPEKINALFKIIDAGYGLLLFLFLYFIMYVETRILVAVKTSSANLKKYLDENNISSKGSLFKDVILTPASEVFCIIFTERYSSLHEFIQHYKTEIRENLPIKPCSLKDRIIESHSS